MTTPKRNSGFTFLEVLIALTILAVAGVGMVVMVNDTQRTLADSRRMVTASYLAREKAFDLLEDGVTTITDRRGAFDDHPGLVWRARVYSTDFDGFYRLRVAVGPRDSNKEYAVVEPAFMER